MKTPTEIKELAKKQIDYDRQLALCGKDNADNVLAFWIMGYTLCQDLSHPNIFANAVEQERREGRITCDTREAEDLLEKLIANSTQEMVECECGHTVPLEFSVSETEDGNATCMPCLMEELQHRLAEGEQALINITKLCNPEEAGHRDFYVVANDAIKVINGEDEQ
jgi:hypothetical protein